MAVAVLQSAVEVTCECGPDHVDVMLAIELEVEVIGLGLRAG